MPHYPLMFTFRDAVSGNGFLAGVTLFGRALMVKEGENEWCIYGVRPAGIAEVGVTPEETYLRFRNRYKEVLFDIASESKDFDSFREEVSRFYQEPDSKEEERWEKAVEEIRTGAVTPEKPFSDLRKEAPETRPSAMSVIRLDVDQRFQASDNVLDTFVLAKAA